VYADKTGPRGDIYTKGSWVMHTLRRLVGDDAFFKAVRVLVYGRADPRPGNFAPQFGTTQGFLKIVGDGTGNVAADQRAAVTLDPHSKILMQSDAIDEYQQWQAKQPKDKSRN
jgi:hypothetical protein